MKRFIALAALVAVIAALGAGPVWAQKFVHVTDLHVTTHTDTWPAMGEFDQDGRNFVNLRDAIVAQNPAFVIVSGDIVNSGSNDNGTNDDGNWTALTSKLYKSGNTYYMKSNYTIPVYFVPGNHDGRKRSQPLYQGLGGYDAYIGKPTAAASGCTAPVYGSGETARDFYFTSGNMLFIGLFSGTDIPNDLNYMNPEGSGLTSAQINFVRTTCDANPGKIKIISMHHPGVNPLYTLSYPHYSNWGTDYKDDQFDGWFGSIYDGTILQSSVGSDGKTFLQTCAAKGVAMVLSGHLHQNVVLDASGVKRAYSNGSWSQGSGTGVNYVQTAEGFNGAYRIINVTSPTAYTVSSPQLTTTLNFPGLKNSEWNYYSLMVEYGVLSFLKIATNYKYMPVLRMKYWVNGVLQGQLNNPASTVIVPWYANIAKGTSGTIKVEVTNSIGTTAATYRFTVLNGADFYYNKMNVGNYADVVDPYNNHTLRFTLNQLSISGGVRYATILVKDMTTLGTWYETVNDKQMKMVDASGHGSKLFMFAGTIFDGTERFVELMIAPYQYPSVKILTPLPNVSTGSCQVQLATNYPGKNVPWQGVGSPYTSADKLKKISYNDVSSTEEYYWWSLSGTSGSRTLTVTLRDSLNTTVGSSITVNYDQSASSPDFRGPWGDSWKTMTWSFWRDGDYAGLNYNYWDQGVSDQHYTGNFMRRNRSEFIDAIASSIVAFPMKYNVPPDATPVWVVDKRAGAIYNYTDGSVSAPPFGTITMKEIYDAAAALLGKDSQGRYRVWTSSNAGRTDAAPILDAVPPTIAITSHSNYSYVSTSTINLSGTASDDYSLSKVEISINGGAYALATGTTSWSKNGIALNPNANIISVKATDSYNKQTIVTITVTYDNTPGSITIASPAANSTGYCRTVPVSGTASDNGGVSKVEVSINEGPWRRASWANGSTSVWRCDVNLAPGTNGIKARVTDVAGNATIASHVANYSTTGSAPAVPPLNPATVTTPTALGCNISKSTSASYDLGQNGVYTISATISVNSYMYGSGTYASSTTYISSSLDQQNWITVASGTINSHCGENCSAGISSGVFYGRYLLVQTSVTSGSSYATNYCYCNCGYTPWAIGSAGNFVVNNVCLTPLADMTNPTVSFSSPAAGALVGSASLPIAGSASDNAGVWGVQTRCNNGSWETASGTTSWKDTLTLTTGTNTIEVRAYDTIGNMATATRQVVYSEGCLMGYWKLDGSTGTVAADASGLYNNGTIVNGPTWVPGQLNNALSFDGSNDYVTVPNSASLNITSKISISAWVKPSAIDAGGQNEILQKSGSFGLKMRPDGKFIGYRWGGPENHPSTTIATAGKWYHVVMTFDGSQHKIYVNGSLQNSETDNAAIPSSTNAVTIGGPGVYFQGLIDEVRVYGKALTADEVQILHMQGCLAGSWKFNETSGTTTADASGYSNIGTLNGFSGTYWVAGNTGLGNALSFDGVNDYVNTTWSGSLNKWSITAWIKDAGIKTGWRSIVQTTEATDRGLYIYPGNGSISFYPYGNSSAGIAPNVWTHVAVTYDGTTMSYYMGGNPSGTYATTTAGGSVQIIRIGGLSSSDGECFSGLIDEVRVYNQALSLEEITAIKNNTKTEEESAGEYSELEMTKPALPKTTQLISCAPNPFTGQTTISFQLSKPAQTTIRIYNITGQEVRTLVNECLRQGYHSVKWDGKSDKGQKLAAGVYLYRMQAGDYSRTNKLTVIK